MELTCSVGCLKIDVSTMSQEESMKYLSTSAVVNKCVQMDTSVARWIRIQIMKLQTLTTFSGPCSQYSNALLLKAGQTWWWCIRKFTQDSSSCSSSFLSSSEHSSCLTWLLLSSIVHSRRTKGSSEIKKLRKRQSVTNSKSRNRVMMLYLMTLNNKFNQGLKLA